MTVAVRVYSTEAGTCCPDCGEAISRCACRAARGAPRGDGTVRVSRETKGRMGSGVTLVTGLPLDEAGLAALAGELKRRCGSGGTVKEGVIEIQGDHRDRLLGELQARGYRAKKAGG